MKTTTPRQARCYFCFHDGDKRKASFIAAQSSNQGKSVVWRFLCRSHRDGWNDGGDWKAPIYPLGKREY